MFESSCVAGEGPVVCPHSQNMQAACTKHNSEIFTKLIGTQDRENELFMLEDIINQHKIKVKAVKITFKPQYNFLSLLQHETGSSLFASSISSWLLLKPLKQYSPLAGRIIWLITSTITQSGHEILGCWFCQGTEQSTQENTDFRCSPSHRRAGKL